MTSLQSHLEGILLPNMTDRWVWSLSGDGEFSVSSARKLIDDKTLRMVGSKTNWCKFVPIKVNILSWRVKLNNHPTRLNLSRRDLEVNNIQASEIAQKAKIKWAIEGDENVKFFHGMLNKKRSQSNIRGIMAGGIYHGRSLVHMLIGLIGSITSD
ncbi:hypothetical protein Tco_1210915 [Tanacetum coccineum]